MAKATLTLPNGTHVAVDGSPEEIAKLMSLYSSEGETGHQKSNLRSPSQDESTAKTKKKSSSAKKGPRGYISDLTEIGFFKQKRNIAEIQKKLEEQGHIYAQTSLSPTLLRLVRDHELRRIKDKDGWVYVN